MDAERCCRRCEFWLPETLDLIASAGQGECLSQDSDIDYPPADHWCPHFSEDANVYEPAFRSRVVRHA